jgi:hypothetical protein
MLQTDVDCVDNIQLGKYFRQIRVEKTLWYFDKDLRNITFYFNGNKGYSVALIMIFSTHGSKHKTIILTARLG